MKFLCLFEYVFIGELSAVYVLGLTKSAGQLIVNVLQRSIVTIQQYRQVVQLFRQYLVSNDQYCLRSVSVHLVGRHDGQEFERRDVSLVLGEGSEAGIVPGVEHALKSFKKGETARLVVKAKHAYGAVGCESLGVPGNADLDYEVTLKAFEMVRSSYATFVLFI